MPTTPTDTKKVFRKCGTCSRTFFYLLNRDFGRPVEVQERAADPLAGGIQQKGRQCGMLWGAALAVGAEAWRRCDDPDRAAALALQATRELVDSFSERTGTVDCRDITGTDFSKPLQMLRYMLFRARGCFNLAEQWAPEAIATAREALNRPPDVAEGRPVNCASEVVRRLGGTIAEQVTVAGLAGGMGLSGQGCGALGAALWWRSVAWARTNPGKSAFFNPKAKRTLQAFEAATGGELRCHRICGRSFAGPVEHADFIREGGCAEVMEVLAQGA